jgi:hypothetical protein
VLTEGKGGRGGRKWVQVDSIGGKRIVEGVEVTNRAGYMLCQQSKGRERESRGETMGGAKPEQEQEEKARAREH